MDIDHICTMSDNNMWTKLYLSNEYIYIGEGAHNKKSRDDLKAIFP